MAKIESLLYISYFQNKNRPQHEIGVDELKLFAPLDCSLTLGLPSAPTLELDKLGSQLVGLLDECEYCGDESDDDELDDKVGDELLGNAVSAVLASLVSASPVTCACCLALNLKFAILDERLISLLSLFFPSSSKFSSTSSCLLLVGLENPLLEAFPLLGLALTLSSGRIDAMESLLLGDG